jgi:hypothetical protein
MVHWSIRGPNCTVLYEYLGWDPTCAIGHMRRLRDTHIAVTVVVPAAESRPSNHRVMGSWDTVVPPSPYGFSWRRVGGVKGGHGCRIIVLLPEPFGSVRPYRAVRGDYYMYSSSPELLPRKMITPSLLPVGTSSLLYK